jgi:hypothetical protein
MLGTSFSTREGEIWDMPFEILKSQLNSGRFVIENDKLVPAG